MSFYSTFAGTNFREWVVSIAKFLGKYVDERRTKQERKTTGHLYFKTPFITEKLFYNILNAFLSASPSTGRTHSAHPRRHLYHSLVSGFHILCLHALISVVFNCLFQKKEEKKGFSPNQSYQKYFAGTNFREFGSKNANFAKFAKISTREKLVPLWLV